DGFGNGLGYSFVLILTAVFREFFGSGSLYGVQILNPVTMGGWYVPNGMMLLAPAAFFIIGFFIWVLRTLKPGQIEMED
ncbi:MAG: NADH:ubiquinone reductase (Na(+)-transporting) subunit D, partial [Candidatus Hydrogenedentes bacterium]|nr:NADH:ubiquinone reductase (Na(+)-transporting) subunit D [Candidatus Hydrogenedentota bacterium]